MSGRKLLTALTVVVLALVVALYFQSDKEGFDINELPTLVAGRSYLITGANSGIGLETARHLVEAGTASRIILACRRNVACWNAKEDLLQSKPKSSNTEVLTVELDLEQLDSIRSCANTMLNLTTVSDQERLVLVNNAGIMGVSEGLEFNPDTNVETTMHVNHLGHFLLTSLIIDKVERVVSVSSLIALHSGSSSTDDWYVKPPYHILKPKNALVRFYQGMRAYARSKRANLDFCSELNRRYPKIVATAAHPGTTRTSIVDNGMNWGFIRKLAFFVINRTPIVSDATKGSLPVIRAAVTDKRGAYFGTTWFILGGPMRVGTCDASWHHMPSSLNQKLRLWSMSEEALDIEFS